MLSLRGLPSPWRVCRRARGARPDGNAPDGPPTDIGGRYLTISSPKTEKWDIVCHQEEHIENLRLLRHFEAVYRLGSFSTAAEELHLTHSAITKSIQALEADLGTQLFHRTTRTVAATEAGKNLYPKAVDLLAFADMVKSSVTANEHELTLLCGPGVVEQAIHPAILKFANAYPEIRIIAMSMLPHLAAEELVQRRAHLLVFHDTSLASMPHRDRMKVVNVIDEPYWMVHRANHPVASRTHSFEEILACRWALSYGIQFERALPEKLRNLLGGKLSPQYRLLSQTACVELARQSDVLTALPERAAVALAKQDRISASRFPIDFRCSISAAYLHDGGREPTVDHFIDCLRM